jgi:hypothetical protein
VNYEQRHRPRNKHKQYKNSDSTSEIPAFVLAAACNRIYGFAYCLAYKTYRIAQAFRVLACTAVAANQNHQRNPRHNQPHAYANPEAAPLGNC